MGSVNINNSSFPHSFSPSGLTKALGHIAAAATVAKKMEDQLLLALGLGAGIEPAAAAILFAEFSILYSYSTVRARERECPGGVRMTVHCRHRQYPR